MSLMAVGFIGLVGEAGAKSESEFSVFRCATSGVVRAKYFPQLTQGPNSIVELFKDRNSGLYRLNIAGHEYSEKASDKIKLSGNYGENLKVVVSPKDQDIEIEVTKMGTSPVREITVTDSSSQVPQLVAILGCLD